jgi:hypothetical protein
MRHAFQQAAAVLGDTGRKIEDCEFGHGRGRYLTVPTTDESIDIMTDLVVRRLLVDMEQPIARHW